MTDEKSLRENARQFDMQNDIENNCLGESSIRIA